MNGFERLRSLGLTEDDANRLADHLEPLIQNGASEACGFVVEVRRGRIVRACAAAMRKMWAIGS